eukprot:TRINITY_DN578_c0_g1_i3.p3 TRINITY_DN578_c0_g1~~TRINITY_DN578_c0_g1_i3.p3  ORF type:complete len:118 (-),score=19.94 TRINITY_DN578_c0_g1_i3:149-502(-)
MVTNATAALMAAATIATASAFVAPHTALPVAKATSSSALRMSSIGNEVMSESVPFLPRNPVLDEFELAGDVGFGECFGTVADCTAALAPVRCTTCIASLCATMVKWSKSTPSTLVSA